MSAALVLDTSGWLFALAGEPRYAEVLEESGPVYVPSLVLAEVDYHLRARREAMWRILTEIRKAPYALEPLTDADVLRAVEIDRKFASAGLGLTDASVVAVAERLGVPRVLTADSDFTIVRFGPRWTQRLELPVMPGEKPRARTRPRRRR